MTYSIISKLVFTIILFFSASLFAMCKNYYFVSGGEVFSPTSNASAACGSAFIGNTSTLVSVSYAGDKCKLEYDLNSDGSITAISERPVSIAQCPVGFISNPDVRKVCGKPCPSECPTSSGNPIDTLAGYKYQSENDLVSSQLGNDLLRNYFWDTDIGFWRFSHEKSLYISNGNLLSAERPGGRVIYFDREVDTEGNTLYWSDRRSWIKVYPHVDGLFRMEWLGSLEEYDSQGRLLRVISKQGDVTDFIQNHLDNSVVVSDSSTNQTFTFFYQPYELGVSFTDTKKIIRIVDSIGQVYRYSYNANGMIEYVSFPDDTPNAIGANPFGEDNSFKQYHYEDLNYPTALTGITDELGNRSFTWAYDSEGRAILSKHDSVGVVDQVTLDFSFVDDPVQPRVIETNSLGYRSIFHYAEIDDERKVTLVERDAHTNSADASISCAAANQHTTYDANGYKNLVTDWQGNVTDFDYDDRGLEISRVEAQRWQGDVIDSVVVATAETKTVTTEWHPDLRLPTKIIEPNRVIIMTYDPENGRELSRVEYAVGSEP